MQWEADADVCSAEVRSGHHLYREKFNSPAFPVTRWRLEGQGRAVEVGCAAGHDKQILARAGARVTGIDIAPRMIEPARDAEPRENGLRVAEYLLEESRFDRRMFSAARRGPELFAIAPYARTFSHYLCSVIKAGDGDRRSRGAMPFGGGGRPVSGLASGASMRLWRSR